MKKYFILLTLICFIGTSWSQEPAEQNVIRVMTFNILHGATTKNDFDLEKLRT